MKLITITLISLSLGLFLGYSALFTAKQIAKATMPRIEITLNQ